MPDAWSPDHLSFLNILWNVLCKNCSYQTLNVKSFTSVYPALEPYPLLSETLY